MADELLSQPTTGQLYFHPTSHQLIYKVNSPPPPDGIELYSTGEEDTAGLDDHWEVSRDGGGYAAAILCAAPSGKVAAPAGTSWISHIVDGYVGDLTEGEIILYKTSIYIGPDVDLGTLSIPADVAVDNDLFDITVNGTTTGHTIGNGNWGSLTPITLDGTGFVEGWNEVVFKTNDDGTDVCLLVVFGTPTW